MRQQITDTILMVRPANFGFNPVTASSNAFQQSETDLNPQEIQELALQEFDGLASKLQNAGVQIILIEDSPEPVTYDAVFPNNWFSTHSNGSLVLYPMCAPMRRLERRKDIIQQLSDSYQLKKSHHLEKHEEADRFLEGTGSLILDRPNRLAYACRSIRTNEQVLEAFCARLGYEKVFFDATDANGQAIYHTNVMMALAEHFVVICMDAIRNQEERRMLKQYFERTDKNIVELSLVQMGNFAGNMLQVRNKTGDTFLVMSEQAYKVLTKTQIEQIEQHTNILYSPVYTIEKFGGGSVRCMMAEVFLPKQ